MDSLIDQLGKLTVKRHPVSVRCDCERCRDRVALACFALQKAEHLTAIPQIFGQDIELAAYNGRTAVVFTTENIERTTYNLYEMGVNYIVVDPNCYDIVEQIMESCM